MSITKPSPAEAKVLARNYLELCLAQFPPLPAHLEQFYVDIPINDNTNYLSHTKIIRPKLKHDPSKPRPLVIYFFGGGFVIGDPDQVTSPAREWAEKFNATVVLPDYRLTPDFHWPTPMTDAFAATKMIASGWAGDYEPFFGARPEDGFVIGGQSAGATVAGVTVGLATHGGEQYKLEKSLTGVFLNTPWFFPEGTLPDEFRDEYKAMFEESEHQTIKADDIKKIIDSLQITDPTSPLISPAAFLREGVSKPWPKSYFQACQYDLFRDDALIFEKMLKRIGTDIKVRLFPDDGHAGMSSMFAVHKSTNPTIKEDTMDGMAWLLDQK